MSELRRKMLTDLRIRNYAERTQETYIAACGGDGARSGALAGRVERRRGAGVPALPEESAGCRVRCSRKSWGHSVPVRGDAGPAGDVARIRYPRLKRRHPVVLSPEEVARLLKAIRNLKHRTVALVLYGAGLRIREALELEAARHRQRPDGDHGSARQGDADRQVVLSEVLLKSAPHILAGLQARALPVSWRRCREAAGELDDPACLKAARVRAGSRSRPARRYCATATRHT